MGARSDGEGTNPDLEGLQAGQSQHCQEGHSSQQWSRGEVKVKLKDRKEH